MQRQMTARDKYQLAVAETLRDWRLSCVTVRRNWHAEREIIKIGIGEIAALRLTEACQPLLSTLAAIEEKVRLLTAACASDSLTKWSGNHEERRRDPAREQHHAATGPQRAVPDDLPEVFAVAQKMPRAGSGGRDHGRRRALEVPPLCGNERGRIFR